MKCFDCFVKWTISLFFLSLVSSLHDVQETVRPSFCDDWSPVVDDSENYLPVCESMHINSRSEAKLLCNCKLIDGNLQLRDFFGANDSISDLSFPFLREIRGLLLIYNVPGEVSLERLFPNLILVRGENLISKYAIVVLNVSGLSDGFFPSLRCVQNGLIYLEKGEQYPVDHPCQHKYASSAIVQLQNSSFTFVANLSTAFESHCTTDCPFCDKDANCCHAQCLGGCSAPADPTACHICENVLQGLTCQANCSDGYYQVNYRCVLRQFCVENQLLIMDDAQKCLYDRNCPAGYQHKNPQLCVPCPLKENCPKRCFGQRIETINDMFVLRDCEIIEEALTINIGDDCFILHQLESSLSSIREVKQFVHVSNTNLKSLHFLAGIRRIIGKKLVRDRFAFLVKDNEYLETVFSPKLLIENGDINFENNRRLCPSTIWKFVNDCQGSNVTRLEFIEKISPIEIDEEGNKTRSDLHVDRQSMTNGLSGSCQENRLEAWISKARNEDSLNITYGSYNGQNLERLSSLLVFYKKIDSEVDFKDSSSHTCPFNGWSSFEKILHKGGSSSFEITNLDYYTTYNISVSIYSISKEKKTNNKTYTKRIIGKTAMYNPSPPTNIQWKSNFPSHLELSWKPPVHSNGIIDHYMIELDLIDVPKYPIKRHIDICSNRATQTLKNFQLTKLTEISSNICEEKPISKGTNGDICSCQLPENYLESSKDGENVTCNYKLNRSKVWDIFKSDDRSQPILHSTSNKGNGNREITTKSTILNITDLEPGKQYSITITACHQPHHFISCVNRKLPPMMNSSLLFHHHFSHFPDCKLCSSVRGRTTVIVKTDIVPSMVTPPEIINRTTDTEDLIEISWTGHDFRDVLSFFIEIRNQDTKEQMRRDCEPYNQTSTIQRSVIRELLSGHYSARIQAVRINSIVNVTDWIPFYFYNSKNSHSVFVTHVLFATILVELVIVVCVYFLWRKIKTYQIFSSEIVRSKTLDHFSLSKFDPKFNIPRSHLKMLSNIPFGYGAFGNVYEAIITLNNDRVKVAVKEISNVNFSQNVNKLINEALIMQNLNCNHVVKLIAVMLDGSRFIYAMEYMQNKDLNTFLRDKHLYKSLTYSKLIKMAAEASDGMAYLESHEVVHKDLAARNCLLDSNLTLKIADLGFAGPPLLHKNKDMVNEKLPIRWMAPESLQQYIFTSKSDTWSYGVLLWEISTRCMKPYENWTDKEVKQSVITYGSKLEISHNITSMFKTLIYKCLQYNPNNRPTFTDIYKYLVHHLPEREKCCLSEVSYVDSQEGKIVTNDPVFALEGDNSTVGNEEEFSQIHEVSSVTEMLSTHDPEEQLSTNDHAAALPLLQLPPTSKEEDEPTSHPSTVNSHIANSCPSIDIKSCQQRIYSKSTRLKALCPLNRPRPTNLNLNSLSSRNRRDTTQIGINSSSPCDCENSGQLMDESFCTCKICTSTAQFLKSYEVSPFKTRLCKLPWMSNQYSGVSEAETACLTHFMDSDQSTNFVHRPFYHCQCSLESQLTCESTISSTFQNFSISANDTESSSYMNSPLNCSQAATGAEKAVGMNV